MIKGITLSVVASILFGAMYYFTSTLTPLNGEQVYGWRTLLTLPFSVNIVKDVSVFSLISLTCSDTHVSVRDWTTGQTAINPFPTGFIPGLSNRDFAVGGPALETQNLQGTNDVAAFTIYEGVMTEGQQALTAARFRAYCDGVGILL